MTARYRAPAADGELFADPPLADIARQLEANSHLLNAAHVRIAGVPLVDYRQRAIEEVLAAATAYMAEGGEPVPAPAARLLVAGHQPDFFHPGVWVKKFVLHGLAARHGYAPLNLVVDNDLVKSATMRVPVVSDDPARVMSVAVPFDRPKGERPHEEYHVADRALFDSFPERLSEYTRAWGFEPLVTQIWPMIGREVDRGATLGTAASRVRRSLERRWGVANYELPVSRLAETRAFHGFVDTILDDLPRFRGCYNAAIQSYRDRHRLRSQNHPAPELGGHHETLEAPFWIWRAGGRRERLFLRNSGFPHDPSRTLLAGDTPVCRMTRAGSIWVGCSEAQRAGRWKIRPRALTLTLFARLCLGDGFIHGLGGGKYDEVTDDIIRRFFHIDPPGYAVVSATLRLALPRFSATVESMHAAERHVRDLNWNPQRFLAAGDGQAVQAGQKAQLIAGEPSDKQARRQWFRELQTITRSMRPALAPDLARAETDLSRDRAEIAANAILASREYAWPLFPEDVLRNLLTRFR